MATEWKLRNTQAIILCCFCCCWFYVVWLKDAAGDAGWLKPYLLNKRRTNVNCGEYVNTNTTKSLSKLFAFNLVFFVFCEHFWLFVSKWTLHCTLLRIASLFCGFACTMRAHLQHNSRYMHLRTQLFNTSFERMSHSVVVIAISSFVSECITNDAHANAFTQ